MIDLKIYEVKDFVMCLEKQQYVWPRGKYPYVMTKPGGQIWIKSETERALIPLDFSKNMIQGNFT